MLADVVFTVGDEQQYDRLLQDDNLVKMGIRDDYPGGFACQSAEDALRLIDEQGKTGVWAVYELQASWKRETKPSLNGWWHALVNNSEVLRKCDSTVANG